jgi:TonB family protein
VSGNPAYREPEPISLFESSAGDNSAEHVSSDWEASQLALDSLVATDPRPEAESHPGIEATATSEDRATETAIEEGTTIVAGPEADQPSQATEAPAAAGSTWPRKVLERIRPVHKVAAAALVVIGVGAWLATNAETSGVLERTGVVLQEALNARVFEETVVNEPARPAVKAPAKARNRPAARTAIHTSEAKIITGAAAGPVNRDPEEPIALPVTEPDLPAEEASFSVAAPNILELPIAAPGLALVPVAAPVPAAAAPPRAPFFEMTDVSVLPQVATQVAPRVPDDLKRISRHDVVVARVLVSQSGQPSRVSLLRKSLAGSRVDEVVVAAVNQWAFTPAKRHGVAVSCWVNVAVPVGLAD